MGYPNERIYSSDILREIGDQAFTIQYCFGCKTMVLVGLGLEAVEEGRQFVVLGMFRSIVLACLQTIQPKVKEEKLVLRIFKTIVLSCLQTRILKPTSLVYLF